MEHGLQGARLTANGSVYFWLKYGPELKDNYRNSLEASCTSEEKRKGMEGWAAKNHLTRGATQWIDEYWLGSCELSTYIPLPAQSSTLGPEGLASGAALTTNHGILSDTSLSNLWNAKIMTFYSMI